MLLSWACHTGRANCWNWLQGDFNLVRIVDGLCTAMHRDKWQSWLADNPVKVNLLNQLVAHCVCRVPITRQQLVPGSAADGAPTSWQDLENDGLACVGEPGGSAVYSELVQQSNLV